MIRCIAYVQHVSSHRNPVISTARSALRVDDGEEAMALGADGCSMMLLLWYMRHEVREKKGERRGRKEKMREGLGG